MRVYQIGEHTPDGASAAEGGCRTEICTNLGHVGSVRVL
jgi:hypothetical protein